MIYIANFWADELGGECGYRLGRFDLVVEASDENEAVEMFKEHLRKVWADGELFSYRDEVIIWLEDIAEMPDSPKEPEMLFYESISAEDFRERGDNDVGWIPPDPDPDDVIEFGTHEPILEFKR